MERTLEGPGKDRRSRRFSYGRGSESGGFPYEIHAEGEVVGRIKSQVDAETICRGRHSVLREAGNRAADLRRFDVLQRRMKNDIRELMQALDATAKVLKARRPREVIRAREEIVRLLRRMASQGYTK